jgi:hypothetical protein
MKLFSSPLILLSLAMTFACVREAGQKAIYLPTEAGMTLQFANVDTEPVGSTNGRTQIRISHSKQTSEGLDVVCSISNLQGTADITFLCPQDGGVFLMASDANKITVLPPGFPDKTLTWQSEGLNYQVIGRAKADIPSVNLLDPIGVWVEATPMAPQLLNTDSKTRIFFLPGIGEAETKVLRQGNWKTINRLVGMGFTDAP